MLNLFLKIMKCFRIIPKINSLFIFLFVFSGVHAQEKIIHNMNGEKDSLKIYLELGSTYEKTNLSKSIEFYLSALRIANSDGNEEAKIDILNHLVDQYEAIEQPEKSIYYELDKFKTYYILLSLKKGNEKVPVLLALGNEYLKQNNDSSLY